MSNLDFVFAVAANYIAFGLALYLIGAVLVLIWGYRRKCKRSQVSKADMVRTSICVIVLVLMEISRQFWDSFRSDRFPVWISRMILPALYLTLGNSIFRLASIDVSDEPSRTDPQKSDSAAT